MARNQVLPSDRLKQPQRPWRVLLVTVVAAALVIGGGLAISTALTTHDSGRSAVSMPLIGGEGKPFAPQVDHKLMVEHVLKSTTPPPPPPAPENFYGNPGPVQCPYGTTANAVDAYGNESNCQANGPGNAQCVAYDDANNCTQYYKP